MNGSWCMPNYGHETTLIYCTMVHLRLQNTPLFVITTLLYCRHCTVQCTLVHKYLLQPSLSASRKQEGTNRIIQKPSQRLHSMHWLTWEPHVCVYHRDLYSSRYLDTAELDLTYTKISDRVGFFGLLDMGTSFPFIIKNYICWTRKLETAGFDLTYTKISDKVGFSAM